MIAPSDLEDLRGPQTYPAVSILLPLQRHRPGNREDPLLLRSLADEATRRLAGLDRDTGAEIVARLDDAIDAVDWHSPSEGLAMYVAPGVSRLLALPFPVTQRIAIGQRFATRELVRGIGQHPRFRVLALGEKPTRLLEGQGSALVESRAAGFPFFVEGTHEEPLPSGGFPVHSSRSEEQHRQFLPSDRPCSQRGGRRRPGSLDRHREPARPGLLRRDHATRVMGCRTCRRQLRRCQSGPARSPRRTTGR
jgi:hypothetical protein